MEFGIEKCAMLITKCLKVNDRRNRTTKSRKENLGILEVDTIKRAGMKEKIKKESLGETRKLLEKNYITEISSNR